MSGRMRKPYFVSGDERKRTFEASEWPEMMSSTLSGGRVNGMQLTPKKGQEPLCARGREGVNIWLYNALVQCWCLTHDVEALRRVLDNSSCKYEAPVASITRLTLRMCVSVAGQMTLIFTSGLSADLGSHPKSQVYFE